MTDGRSRIVWIGHSTVLMELDGVRLLTDPLLRPRIAHLRRSAPVAAGLRRGIDAVLISHVHWDHLDLASLALLGRGVPIVVPRGAGALLRRRRFSDVREVDEGDIVDVGGVSVIATHAEHASSRGPLARPSTALGFVVAGTRRIYFAGDTDLFDGMSALSEPPLDVALLPVAGWGPRLPAGHLDAEAAARALTLLRPRLAIPIHWATLMPAYRRVPHRADAGEAFAAHARDLAPEVEVRVLGVGDECVLDPEPSPTP